MWIYLGKFRIIKKIDLIEFGIKELFLKFVFVSEKSFEVLGIYCVLSNL